MTRSGAILLLGMSMFLVAYGYLTIVNIKIAALLFTAVFVVICAYLALSLIIRGKFEANGYVMTWKQNPVGMAVWLILDLSVPAVMIYGLIIHW